MDDFIFMAELESDLRDEYMMNPPEDFVAKEELKDEFFDKLKVHLHLNMIQRHNKAQESDVIIDLASSTFESEENASHGEPDKEKSNVTVEKKNLHQLVKPEME